MLYEDIRRAADAFHRNPKVWNSFYAEYQHDKKRDQWDSCSVSNEEAERLRRFLNQWATHYQAKSHQMAAAVNAVLPSLNLLRDEDLLRVDFGRTLDNGETIAHVIEVAFETIVSCGKHYESTGASKILHVVNPNLFVMWDIGIRKAYGIRGGGDGLVYSQRFLPKMQQIAKTAVEECKGRLDLPEDAAIQHICACGDTLAKVIDEYNWATYVGGVPEESHAGENETCSSGLEPDSLPGPCDVPSDVIVRISERFSRTGGSADIPLMKEGKSFKAQLRDDGVEVSNLGSQPFLPWQVFMETVALLERNGGTARKGDAMYGRLGDHRLPLSSVEGNIASIVYGKKKGNSVFRRISPIAAILDWCGLCANCRGELRLAK